MIHISKQDILSYQKTLGQALWKFVTQMVIEIEIFIVVALCLMLLRRIPYINIIVTSDIVYICLIIVARILFKIPINFIVLIAVVTLILTGLHHIFGATESADQLANFSYFLLWIASMLSIKDVWKNHRKHL